MFMKIFLKRFINIYIYIDRFFGEIIRCLQILIKSVECFVLDSNRVYDMN